MLCVLVGTVEAFTLYVLSKFAERYNASTYGVLVRRTLGKKLTALLASILVVYLWGSCVVYLVRQQAAPPHLQTHTSHQRGDGCAGRDVWWLRWRSDPSAAQIIVGDTFSTLGRLYTGPDSFLASRNHVILLAGVVLAPLCLLRCVGLADVGRSGCLCDWLTPSAAHCALAPNVPRAGALATWRGSPRWRWWGLCTRAA